MVDNDSDTTDTDNVQMPYDNDNDNDTATGEMKYERNMTNELKDRHRMIRYHMKEMII